MTNYDVVIIGGGPAGASAALYAARGGLDVCIVHNGKSALDKAVIQNYYGTGTLDGAELYKLGLQQAAEVGANIIDAEVTFAARGDGEGFEVTTAIGKFYCKRLVIASGTARRTPDIDGLKEYEGKGVSYCAVCDAFFCRKKRVGVLGTGEYAKHEYQTLAAVANEIYLLTNSASAEFEIDKAHVVEKKIKRVVGKEQRLCAVEFDDGSRLELDALFVALGVMGSGAIAKSMGVITDGSGAVVVDERGMTNVDGLYAAGDCTSGIKQVAKAVYDGMNVGLNLISDIKNGSEKR